MWIKELKIAIIEKNTETLDRLMDITPELQTQEEIQEALYLLQSAAILVNGLKNETQASMQQLKKNINFIKSTQPSQDNKFNAKY